MDGCANLDAFFAAKYHGKPKHLGAVCLHLEISNSPSLTHIEHCTPTIISVYMSATVIDYCSMLLARITSDITLDTAYDWLCQRRSKYMENARVWPFRRLLPYEKQRL